MVTAAQGGINAADYATLQAAHDAQPGTTGGLIYLPKGVTDVTAYAPVLITKPGTRLVGASGIGLIETAPTVRPVSTLLCTDANKDVIKVVNTPYCAFENFGIEGHGGLSAGTQVGLRMVLQSPDTVLPGFTAHRLRISKCASHGMVIDNSYLTTMTYCQFTGNYGDGLHYTGSGGLGHPHQIHDNNWFMQNRGYGIYMNAVNLAHFRCCSFQNNGQNTTPAAGVAFAQSYMTGSTNIHFDNCQWEGIEQGVGTGSGLRFVGAYVEFANGVSFTNGCKFICNVDPASAAVAIQIYDSHHCTVDDLFLAGLSGGGTPGTGVRLSKVGTICRHNTIGRMNYPNGNIKPFDGTEGTDHEATYVNFQDQFAATGIGADGRDVVAAASKDHIAYKIKGQIIYVRGSTPPLQYWDGSAWVSV